jgi:hypothetical protein
MALAEPCEIVDLAGYRAAPLLLRIAGAAAASAFAVDPAARRGAARPNARAAALARHIQIYLVHVGFGIDLTTLGRAVGRDRTTLRHACAAVEDRRDDGGFDAALGVLESALRRWVVAFAEPRR